MNKAAEEFERELEVFRTESEQAKQFLYAHLAIHDVAADSRSVYKLLNRSPLLWNTIAGALQTSAFIALGRVFDQNSPHNIDRLLRLAQDNPRIFSKAALSRRKQGSKSAHPEWLDEYLKTVYEPKPADFRRLRSHVRKRRKIYEARYRDLRSKVFAHKELLDGYAAALFANTNIRELQQLCPFLGSLYVALWQMYFNGEKPILRPERYSTKRMRNLPSPAGLGKRVQEEITLEAERFLMSASRLVENG
jgi:hypothetical protein